MTLVLNVLRCPDSAPPEMRRLEGGEFRIGRGADNDWVLADPERVLSKHHCVIAWRAGGWQIADTSTNGTYLNRDAEPLGAGKVEALSDGDRIRLGPYEIEARLEEARPAPRQPGGDVFGDPFGDDPFAASQGQSAQPADSWFGDGAAGDNRDSLSLPEDFDPLAPEPAPFDAPVVPDHSPSQGDAFRPPPTAPRLLPDDWDLDLTPSTPTPTPATPTPATPTPTPTVQPEPPPSAPPLSQPLAAPAQQAAPGADASGALAAFLRGAGIDAPAPADPAAMMENLGSAFRALVHGLRQAMIARAAVKGEFRIEQTMIRAQGNNPLKFSADDDDALSALLGLGRRTGMTAEAAIDDALRDIRLHEIAVMGAMQDAVRTMLAGLDPAGIRAEAEKSRALLPAQRGARAFDLFAAKHAAVTAALADDFDSVFGKAFARAYEKALAEAEAAGR